MRLIGNQMKNCSFCILNSSFLYLTFCLRSNNNHYQAFDTVFHHLMKHLEVRQKYSATLWT